MESIGDPWIHITKGQWCKYNFRVIISSRIFPHGSGIYNYTYYVLHVMTAGTLLLTWFNFNSTMDK